MNGIEWEQLTVGVAAILGLVIVANTMRRAMKDLLSFLYNHLSTVTAALERVADRLEGLENKIDDQHDALDRLGSDLRPHRGGRTKITK
jgi:hypothetical protein